MKRLIFILIVCIISACSTDTHKEVFPIDFVLKNTLPQQNKLLIKHLQDFKQIDTTFLKKWFEGLPIPETDNEKFDCHYSDCYFIDHRQIDDKIAFSIIKNSEGGILKLYYLTYETLSKKISGINYLTFEGGDEGYIKRNIVEWTDKNSIRVTSVEHDNEELTDSTILIKQDSSISQFSYADRPFKAKEIFRQSKTDTIKSKKE